LRPLLLEKLERRLAHGLQWSAWGRKLECNPWGGQVDSNDVYRQIAGAALRPADSGNTSEWMLNSLASARARMAGTDPQCRREKDKPEPPTVQHAQILAAPCLVYCRARS
jgi:hypothetical protein